MTETNKDNIQKQGNTQYLYHRIPEVAEKLMEEAFLFLFGQTVISVFFS